MEHPGSRSSQTPSSTETIDVGRPQGLQIRQFRLRVLSGPGAGLTYSSDRERVTIGTHPSNQLVLSDAALSRFHCEISVDTDMPVVLDLGSRNGTRVDRVSVEKAYLADGATLELGRTRLRFEIDDRRVSLAVSQREQFGLLVGRSMGMRAVFTALEHAAASDATILIEGETGTGKDAAAESIHLEGRRQDRPFVVIDCSAIPAQLLESELFGHERGAFTGAETARIGAFEAANGGTVFLDEIGELSLALQPKFLRALESQTIQRLGGTRRIPIDVRIIAATNRNLRQEVNSKRFRPDLYYRLAVLEIVMPPLRQRLDDLPCLVETILGHLLDQTGASPARERVGRMLAPAFLDDLRAHRWPGNVRELRNYLERCLALETAPPVIEQHGTPSAGLAVDSTLPLSDAREQWLAHFERQYIADLLAKHGGKVASAAKAAGIDRTHFYRLMSRAKPR